MTVCTSAENTKVILMGYLSAFTLVFSIVLSIAGEYKLGLTILLFGAVASILLHYAKLEEWKDEG